MKDQYFATKQNLKVILLAEDDEDDIFLFTDTLDTLYKDVDIKVVNNGLQVLNSLHELPPSDIIFLDINMPLMDGIECLKRIRNLSETIPIIILTTSDSEALIKQAKASGASGFISKPNTMKGYYKAIAEVLSINWEDKDAVFYLNTH